MRRPARRRALAAAFAALLAPAAARAQAFTPPRGVLALTLAYQYVENTGHRLDDGTLLRVGQSVDASLLLEGTYAATDRLALTLGLPYVFARYTSDGPSPANLPVDTCRCWHSSFQDFALLARYRFGGRALAVTPTLGLVLPSHAYAYEGEAVVGRRLREAQLGVSAAWAPPRGPFAGFDVQASYAYAFVERPIDVPVDRSFGAFSVGWRPIRRLHVGVTASWQVTHGGLRVPQDLGTPERFVEHDRILRDDFRRLGGGLSWSVGRVDLFASYTAYVAGRNTHDGRAITVGASAYFGGPLGW